MKGELDIRLPLSVFRKVPFIYTGANYKLFTMGTPLEYLSYMHEEIPVFLPCTLSGKETNAISDLLFSFAFPFIDNGDRLVIYLTHPIWLENKRNISLLHDFLDEITTYFQMLDEISLFIEGHRRSKGQVISPDVAYPTSLTHFSYDVNKLSEFTLPSKEYYNQLKDIGFTEYNRLLCYEGELKTVLNNLQVSDQILPYELLTDTKDKKLTLTIEDAKPSDMSIKNYSFTNEFTFISPQCPFEIGDHSVISFHDKKFVGFFQWTPNLFELPITALPIPFLYPDMIGAHQFTTGKIFRFGVMLKDSDLFKGLLHKTMLSMKQKGIKICQIGYIDEQDEVLTSLFDQLGFKVIDTLQILKKDIK